ncbi:MAG: ABC transporter ATP-binding protein [Candidatus Rokubacteria bacterium]|nr:ABC transporter ATP-binding protein [Candidatus Rokubacteria bacterium]
MLDVSNLAVAYDEVHAVRDVSLHVGKAQIVALIGSNGAGKSTILKTISGLLRPSLGDIRFCGESLVGASPSDIVRKGIALVPEGRRLFTKMTVRENLEMGERIGRARATGRAGGFEQVFELFPILFERRRQLAGTMSGGEQQMLSIARALMTAPTLCMLDEPSLGLGPKVIADILEVVVRLRKSGMTIVIVEQNVQQVLQIADYGYVLENARVALEGDAAQLMGTSSVKKAYLGLA